MTTAQFFEKIDFGFLALKFCSRNYAEKKNTAQSFAEPEKAKLILKIPYVVIDWLAA